MTDMAVELLRAEFFQNCPDQSLGIAFSAVSRVGFQRLQKKSILITLKTKGGNILITFLPNTVQIAVLGEKASAKILVEVLLCPENLLMRRQVWVMIRTVFLRAFGIHLHQLTKLKLG